MRLTLLAFAASTLALSGCGKQEATGNTAAVDEAVSAEDFATNDTTAIDAATGADANMAADVDINFLGNAGDEGVATPATNRTASRTRPRARRDEGAAPTNQATPPAPAPAPEPAATNSN